MHMFINIQYLSYEVIHNKYMQSNATFVPLLNDFLSTELNNYQSFFQIFLFENAEFLYIYFIV